MYVVRHDPHRYLLPISDAVRAPRR